MRSPRFSAMGPRGAAGWRSSASSLPPVGRPGPRPGALTTRIDRVERQSQHDPRGRAERAGAARLEPAVATKPVPDRQPADAPGRERQGRAAAAAAGVSPAPTRRRRCAPARPCLATTPRVRIQTPSLAGSINLKGARFDDLVAGPPARDDRQEFAAGSPALAGRRAGRLFRRLRLDRRRASPCPTPTRCGPPSSADSHARPAGHAELDQPDRPAVRADRSRSTTAICSPSAARLQRSAPRRSRYARSASSAAPTSRTTRRRWTNHVGPISLLGGKADYDIDWKTLDEDGAGRHPRQHRRLARLHRQILADRAGAADGAPIERQLPQERRAARYQADYAARADDRRPGPGRQRRKTRLFAGAKEKAWLDRYESAGIAKLSKSIDWGWFEWFMRPIFDLLHVAVPRHRQFRRGDHLPDLHRPRHHVPDRRTSSSGRWRRCARSSRR